MIITDIKQIANEAVEKTISYKSNNTLCLTNTTFPNE